MYQTKGNTICCLIIEYFSGFSLPPTPKCMYDLLTNGSQLQASSQAHSYYTPDNALLYHQPSRGRAGSWAARFNDGNQWLQADLGQISKITIISTQGRAESNQWVKTYTISFSVFGYAFQNIMDGKNLKVLFSLPSLLANRYNNIILRYFRYFWETVIDTRLYLISSLHRLSPVMYASILRHGKVMCQW